MDRLGDKEIDQYSLILFDFDKYDIKEFNRKIINFIKPRIKANSTVKIVGYTDKTGDDAHNLQLSTNRAIETAKGLNQKQETASGVGESTLLYDNNLPEGRFYCRTVVINVETPIK